MPASTHARMHARTHASTHARTHAHTHTHMIFFHGTVHVTNMICVHGTIYARMHTHMYARTHARTHDTEMFLLQVVTGSSEGIVDFGALPWGCQKCQSVTLVNRGRANLPVRLIISSVSSVVLESFVNISMFPIVY